MRFDLVERRTSGVCRACAALVQVSNYEAEPTEARRLTFLHRALASRSRNKDRKGWPAGFPDFASPTDQAHEVTRLSDATDEGSRYYIHLFALPRNPTTVFAFQTISRFCESDFTTKPGPSLILFTNRDRPRSGSRQSIWSNTLTHGRITQRCGASTGTVDEVRAAADPFGTNFWNDEGFLTHSFHTVVITAKAIWRRTWKETNLPPANWRPGRNRPDSGPVQQASTSCYLNIEMNDLQI